MVLHACIEAGIDHDQSLPHAEKQNKKRLCSGILWSPVACRRLANPEATGTNRQPLTNSVFLFMAGRTSRDNSEVAGTGDSKLIGGTLTCKHIAFESAIGSNAQTGTQNLLSKKMQSHTCF